MWATRLRSRRTGPDPDDPESGGQPLDLSLAVTRSVSPIHIEYLKNMGVEASMSVSIMKDGELWGLFACHHHSPRYIEYERRTALEMFAHMFSYELSRFEDQQRKKTRKRMKGITESACVRACSISEREQRKTST